MNLTMLGMLAACSALVVRTDFRTEAFPEQKTLNRSYWTLLASHKGPYADPAHELNEASRATGLFDLPLFRDAALWYGSEMHNPTNPAVASWRRVVDNYARGDQDPKWKCLEANAKPDVPVFVSFGAKRSYPAQVGKIDLDYGDFKAWRARHPNLVALGVGREWCNDIYNMSRCFADEKAVNGGFLKALSKGAWETPEARAELKARLFDFPQTHAGMLRRARAYFDHQLALYWGASDLISLLRECFCVDHVGAAWGAKIIAVETTDTSGGGDAEFRWDVQASFIRGAARQFSIPWQWYVAQYVDGFASDGRYDRIVMCNLAANTPRQNPRGGCSPSLIRRICHYAYLNGANFVEMEDWGLHLTVKNADGASVLSARGEDFAAYHDFTKAHPDRGETYAPVAILTPFDQGYTYCGGFNWRSDKVEYRKGDHLVDGIFFTIVPGFERGAGIRKGKEYNLHNTEMAMMYDVLVPDSPQADDLFVQKLLAYPAAILAGEYPDLPRVWANAEKYVRAGGTLLAPRANVPAGTLAALAGGNDVLDEKGVKVATAYDLGQGRLIVSVSDWMVPDFTDAKKVVGETLRGIRKFPEIAFFLKRFQRELFPFAVKGSCQYGANRTKDGWWLWAFNNDGVTKFIDTFEKIDERAAHTVTVDLKGVRAQKVTELVTGREMPVRDGRFAYTIPAAQFAIFKIVAP